MASSSRPPSGGYRCRTARIAALCGVFVWVPVAGNAQASPDCPAVADQLARSLPMRSCVVRGGGAHGSHPTPLRRGRIEIQSDEVTLGPARAFLYSALLPGVSQWKMGQRRWMAYVILEGVSWVAYGRTRSSALNLKDGYQTLAWDQARTYEGDRVDGEFAYYEAMEKFERSGAFDLDPSGPGLQPQTDPSTFNGKTWALAMQIFFAPGATPGPGDPEYADALSFYRNEGYDERFEWTWAGQPEEWEGYRDLIESSDEDFRRASQYAGVIIANHLLSGVDGFVTARIRAAAGEHSVARLRLARDERTRGIELVLQVRR